MGKVIPIKRKPVETNCCTSCNHVWPIIKGEPANGMCPRCMVWQGTPDWS